MTNISIIFTGGTIGSLTKNEWVGIDSSTNYMLLSKYDCKGKDVVFNTSSPYSILSENLTAKELNLLQKAIKEELDKKPDGIIVTHGTDTLQYTAAAIEFAFANADVPIVLVSADYPLDNEASNGFINFEAAVEFIRTGKEKGVFVSYMNVSDPEVGIYIASRLRQHCEGFSDLFDITTSCYATYNGVVETYMTKLEKAQGIGIVEYTENSHILSIESTPGNSYDYSLDGIKAIILKPYHSATLNTENSMLSQLCQRAKEKNIPVFVSGVRSGVNYESSKLFEELNITAAPYSTYISLYMKIWAAISLGKDIVEFVNTQIAHEWVK